jgi:hypothetical protein
VDEGRDAPLVLPWVRPGAVLGGDRLVDTHYRHFARTLVPMARKLSARRRRALEEALRALVDALDGA